MHDTYEVLEIWHSGSGYTGCQLIEVVEVRLLHVEHDATDDIHALPVISRVFVIRDSECRVDLLHCVLHISSYVGMFPVEQISFTVDCCVIGGQSSELNCCGLIGAVVAFLLRFFPLMNDVHSNYINLNFNWRPRLQSKFGIVIPAMVAGDRMMISNNNDL